MAVRFEIHELCAELREELARRGVPLPALMPIAEPYVSPNEQPPVPLIWLGTCRAATARRLLEVVRQVPPLPPPDLRTLVREANARSEQDFLIKNGEGL
jgi:hypothetical protein